MSQLVLARSVFCAKKELFLQPCERKRYVFYHTRVSDDSASCHRGGPWRALIHRSHAVSRRDGRGCVSRIPVTRSIR